MEINNSRQKKSDGWLNRTVLGVGLTSLFSDWSHETATAVLPAFLAVIGAGPAWLGVIEGGAGAGVVGIIGGVGGGLSSFQKPLPGPQPGRVAATQPAGGWGRVNRSV